MSILYTCSFFLFFVLHFHNFCRILLKDKYFCLLVMQKTVRRYIMPKKEITNILRLPPISWNTLNHSTQPATVWPSRYSVPSSPLICQRIQTATSSSIRLPNSWIRIRNFPSCCKKARHMWLPWRTMRHSFWQQILTTSPTSYSWSGNPRPVTANISRS